MGYFIRGFRNGRFFNIDWYKTEEEAAAYLASCMLSKRRQVDGKLYRDTSLLSHYDSVCIISDDYVDANEILEFDAEETNKDLAENHKKKSTGIVKLNCKNCRLFFSCSDKYSVSSCKRHKKTTCGSCKEYQKCHKQYNVRASTWSCNEYVRERHSTIK